MMKYTLSFIDIMFFFDIFSEYSELNNHMRQDLTHLFRQKLYYSKIETIQILKKKQNFLEFVTSDRIKNILR